MFGGRKAHRHTAGVVRHDAELPPNPERSRISLKTGLNLIAKLGPLLTIVL